MMKIGELSKRITLLQITTTIDENGFAHDEEMEFATVWAAVTNLHGKEYFAAKAVQAENTIKFTIRYRSGITTNTKIRFQDRLFNITDIDDIKYKRKYLEIKAVEVLPSGQN
jgi:SPP1 family predicted phage head-tail adaptor